MATNDDAVAASCAWAASTATWATTTASFPGLNARMQEFSAVLGLKTLETLETNVQARNRLAALYRRELADVPGITFQLVHPGDRCSYKDLTVMVDEAAFGLSRDALAAGPAGRGRGHPPLLRPAGAPPHPVPPLLGAGEGGRPAGHRAPGRARALSLPCTPT